jgi:hypothetical protein
MYYSYVKIDYVATSFSPARTDLALKLLSGKALKFQQLSGSKKTTRRTEKKSKRNHDKLQLALQFFHF